MKTDMSEILPQKPCALPDSWVERLFQRMEDRYGAMWADRYGQFPRQRVKDSWAEDLAGISGDELRRGLDACKQSKFPPTLPEFISLCRPETGPETAYHEAVEQISKREAGADVWGHPAIYWAAAKIGKFDLQNSTWNQIKARWTETYTQVRSVGFWPEIPPHREALPAPGQTTLSQEEAHERIEQAVSEIKPPADPKGWAKKIIASPEGRPAICLQMAAEAMRVSE